MNEEKLLIATMEDKINRCQDRYMLTYTNFLDLRQQSIIYNKCKCRSGVNLRFVGGYDDADRKIAMFLPDYPIEDNPLSAIRVSFSQGFQGKKLSHGDYLGSLTALGVKREKIGDLLVRKDGCDIVLLKEIADFFLLHYNKAGRANLTVKEISLSELLVPEGRFEEKEDTVPSLRLDNVVASAFGTARGSAATAITRGLVFINGLQCEKVDKSVQERDIIVLRGKGKAIIKAVGGITRKNRISITIDRFI